MIRLNLSEKNILNVTNETCRCLNYSGIVAAVPTETVYGLVCNWGDNVAIEKIYKMKGRDDNKPLAMFATDVKMAEKSGMVINPLINKIVRMFCPGPITIVASGHDNVKIGLRIPDHAFILALIHQIGAPLASTSANRSGEQNTLTADAAVANLTMLPDILIDGGEITAGSLASTVIDVSRGDLKIIRHGPITEEMLKKIL